MDNQRMSSSLLVLSEADSSSVDTLKSLFNKLTDFNFEQLFILIHIENPNKYSINELIIQLSHIYNTTYDLKTQNKLSCSITVILENEEYDTHLASTSWSKLLYSSNVDINKIPKSYINHIFESDRICISLKKLQVTVKTNKNIHNLDSIFKEIPVVAVGGTFDHLHDGHKILLTTSAFLTKKTLIIGVTGHDLLKNKKYIEYLESYEKRVNQVKSFLYYVRPDIKPNIYEINDVCGPTAKIKNIDALVVSLESAKGAEFVNNTRLELGWNKLQVYTIGIVGNSDSETFENKLSSTEIRRNEYLKKLQNQ